MRVTYNQGFMQDENVARRDPGKVLFEYLVGCFGTSQLERATRFPNVPTRARNSFLSVQYYYLGKLTVQLILKHSIIATCYVFSDSEIFIRHLNHTIQQNAIKNNTNRKKHVGRQRVEKKEDNEWRRRKTTNGEEGPL